MSRCQHNTLKGGECPYNAYHCYDGKHVCGIHLKYMKSLEECSICLCEMKNSPDRFKLGCGHTFHKSCLAYYNKAECPLCRRPYLPIDAMFVFSDTISNPLIFDVFSTHVECPPFILDIYTKVVGIANKWKNGLLSLHYVTSIYDQIGGTNSSILDAVRIFEKVLLHIKDYGSLNGFNITCQDNKIIYY